MFACVQSVGTVPVSYDCWNITLNTGAISLATSLMILVGSKFGPYGYIKHKKSGTSNIKVPHTNILSEPTEKVESLHNKYT
jgi:hypothetical protein